MLHPTPWAPDPSVRRHVPAEPAEAAAPAEPAGAVAPADCAALARPTTPAERGAPPVDAHAPAVVLDTNAVLDWLVFRHPACRTWSACFAHARVRWLASEAMRVELAHVLARPGLAAWSPQPGAVWDAWARWAEPSAAAVPAGAAGRLRCTDPDDQKFIDLALARGARWLVSRDRAVLRLARRTRALGLEVLTPESWTAALPPA